LLLVLDWAFGGSEVTLVEFQSETGEGESLVLASPELCDDLFSDFYEVAAIEEVIVEGGFLCGFYFFVVNFLFDLCYLRSDDWDSNGLLCQWNKLVLNFAVGLLVGRGAYQRFRISLS
jgi:hypothetical protein